MNSVHVLSRIYRNERILGTMPFDRSSKILIETHRDKSAIYKSDVKSYSYSPVLFSQHPKSLIWWNKFMAIHKKYCFLTKINFFSQEASWCAWNITLSNWREEECTPFSGGTWKPQIWKIIRFEKQVEDRFQSRTLCRVSYNVFSGFDELLLFALELIKGISCF